MRRTLLVVTTIALASITSCSNSDNDASDAAPKFAGTLAVTTDPGPCDFLDTKKCVLPFPSDAFTVGDDSTDTGRRIDFTEASLPTNKDGVAIDPDGWSGNDGFSPGSEMITYVAGLDLEETGAAPITDIGSSLDDDAPIVVLDTDTGDRVPYWAELDSNVEPAADRPLLVHPARNFAEGHHIAIALRNLRTAEGETIEPGDAFRAYRDRLETNDDALEARRAAMETNVFKPLEDAGADRGELYLAWDFTVASERNLSERMLSIRDRALEEIGDGSPPFKVEAVVENPDPGLARRVIGTFTVPLFLTGAGEPGSRFELDEAGLPVRNENDFTASFMCNIPSSAATEPARPVVYGHGLLGAGSQINEDGQLALATEHNMALCATNWIGMSADDVGNAVKTLGDLGNFPTMADRLQQGMLNTILLGRLMHADNGFTSDAAFQRDAQPLLDTDEVYFYGNSQGGIMGAATTAVSTEWTRAVLGVGAGNYSVLLQRSVDFDVYAAILKPAYPDPYDRTLGLALIQMLWDRGEANGYVQHLAGDPYEATPDHDVLWHIAFGDHQVANVGSDTMARTAGVGVHRPALAGGRSPDVDPVWGTDDLADDFDGSGLVYWDSRAPAPPTTNTPPHEGEDPHSDPRNSEVARRQIDAFLRPDGRIIDVCDGAPCTAPPS